jgi:hypothetical protein
MKRRIPLIVIVVLLAVLIYPIMAISQEVFTRDAIITGGGVITEGSGTDIKKITFGVNLLLRYYVNEAGEFVNEEGTPTVNGELVFAESPKGNLQFNFHNTGNGELDKGKFSSTAIQAAAIRPSSHVDTEGEFRFLFVNINADGKFNGEDGWSMVIRLSDYGAPGIVKKTNPANRTDAIRITLYDSPYPTGGQPAVYDTASVDEYPHEDAWRTILDGGNMTVYYQK